MRPGMPIALGLDEADATRRGASGKPVSGERTVREPKEWVIDVDANSLRDGERAAALERARRFAQRAGESTVGEEGYYVLGPVPDRTRLLLLLAYALGPLAPVIMSRGRRQLVWAGFGVLGLPLWAGIVWKWPEVSAWLASGRIPLLPALIVAVGLFLLTFASWGRTIFLTGWDARFFPERLPHWLQHPTIVGVLGLVAPGSGLLVTAAPRRAAFAMWNGGLTLLAGALVACAPVLWKSNQLANAGAIAPRVLEVLFVVAFVIGVAGALVWIFGALDGTRLATYRAGRRTPARGDWFALAILAALIVFFVTFEPRSLAQDLDRRAAGMHEAGLVFVPLPVGMLATHLDASRPSYTLRLADYYAAVGHEVEARRIRDELRTRWEEYSRLTGRGTQDPWVPVAVPVSPLPGAPLSKLESLADEELGEHIERGDSDSP